jgi:hypothetical protein
MADIENDYSIGEKTCAFFENYSFFKFQPMRAPDDFRSVLKPCS